MRPHVCVHMCVPARATVRPSVAAVFAADRDDKLEVPYAQQGDPAMYSAANVKARKKLQTHPAVKDAIKRVRGSRGAPGRCMRGVLAAVGVA